MLWLVNCLFLCLSQNKIIWKHVSEPLLPYDLPFRLHPANTQSLLCFFGLSVGKGTENLGFGPPVLGVHDILLIADFSEFE